MLSTRNLELIIFKDVFDDAYNLDLAAVLAASLPLSTDLYYPISTPQPSAPTSPGVSPSLTANPRRQSQTQTASPHATRVRQSPIVPEWAPDWFSHDTITTHHPRLHSSQPQYQQTASLPSSPIDKEDEQDVRPNGDDKENPENWFL